MSDPTLGAEVAAAKAYEALFVPALFGQWAPRVADAARLRVGERVLDVACGMGRHLEVLIGRGTPAVGVDRSPTLLDHAPEAIRGFIVRGDMRNLPFADRMFLGLLSFFTSFGYFGTRDAHLDLLTEFARVALPGGRLVLDVANPPHVLRTLASSSERIVEGHTAIERRFVEHRGRETLVVKAIQITDAAGRNVASYREEVSLYERDALIGMLSKTGWMELKSLGNYQGDDWSPQTPRLIVVAERRAA